MNLPEPIAEPIADVRTDPRNDACDRLIARLAQGGDGPIAQQLSCFRACLTHTATRVDIEHPVIAIVLEGHKKVYWEGRALAFRKGDVMLVSQPSQLDVTHTPDAVSGRYLGVAIPIGEAVREAARLIWAGIPVDEQPAVAALTLGDLVEALESWSLAVLDNRGADMRLALVTVVLRLCERGHTALLRPPAPGIVDQVRRLVRSDPARNWQSRDFESALGLSGATLRRRLAERGQTLRELVLHTRLACAIDLLWATDWPIKTVAAKVGYRSASSFAQRFQHRYGLDPGSIGNAG